MIICKSGKLIHKGWFLGIPISMFFKGLTKILTRCWNFGSCEQSWTGRLQSEDLQCYCYWQMCFSILEKLIVKIIPMVNAMTQIILKVNLATALTDSINWGVGWCPDSLQALQQNVHSSSQKSFLSMVLNLSTFTPFISRPFLQFLGGSRFSSEKGHYVSVCMVMI